MRDHRRLDELPPGYMLKAELAHEEDIYSTRMRYSLMKIGFWKRRKFLFWTEEWFGWKVVQVANAGDSHYYQQQFLVHTAWQMEKQNV